MCSLSTLQNNNKVADIGMKQFIVGYAMISVPALKAGKND
jgi:hypothetical protein